ncbi:hypothetical protein [Promicromonospora soli]
MTEFRTDWLVFPVSAEVAALVVDVVEELVGRNELSLEEAVARINAQWGGLDMTSPTDISLHETGFFWATVMLYEQPIPDWWEGADRSSWTRSPAPPADSGCWTVSEARG